MKKYLKSRWRVVLLCFGMLLIFSLVARLGGLARSTVCYGLLLCICFGLAATVWDILRFFRRHRELRQTDPVLSRLPNAESALEEDYQALIETLCAKLRETQSANDRRIRELTDDLSLWAHQIKTPLAAAQLLLPEEPERAGEELLRMEQYVQTLLSVLRLDSDSTDFVLRKVEVDPVIRASLRKFSGPFIRKKLKLHYEGTALTAVTDEKWLSFVLEQVLANALKYTSSGSITIRTQESRLIVEDTGIGIAPEDLPRVFEKGYTGYNGRADKRATGIGLYLCKRIMTQLGHGIAVESTLGEGTKVTLELGREG